MLNIQDFNIKLYAINEIFVSIQGEGYNVGMAAVFVRFANCNLKCAFCDTDYSCNIQLTFDQIIDEIKYCSPTIKNIILTGGEPLMQVDNDFTYKMKKLGYKVHIETNGCFPAIDNCWITCSPKTQNPVLKQASEVKYLIDQDTDLNNLPYIESTHKSLSPKWADFYTKNVTKCVSFILEHPEYRLTIQIHKFLRLR